MPGAFPVRPPIGASETASSYASRLARANGFDTLWGLCGFVGMRLKDLGNGSTASLSRLARISTVDEDRLRRATIRRNRNGRLSVCRETVSHDNVRTSTIAFCPACVRDDRATESPIMPSERAWQRFEPITVCGTHGMELVVVRVPLRRTNGDFVSALEWCDAAGLLPADGQPAVFSPRQAYLAGRLRGETVSAGAFVDGLAWYAAARMFECVGTADLAPGLIRFRKNEVLDDPATTADRGFDILSGGREAFAAWIADRIDRSRTEEACPAWPASRTIFGDLADTLERIPDPAYDPVRAMLVEAATERLPLAPGSTYLGIAIPERRLHSLRSAANEAELPVERMAEILRDAGLLPADADALTPERVLMPAAPVDDLLESLRHLVPAAEIARIFGLPESQTRTAVELTCLTRMPCPDGRIPDGAFDRRDVLALKRRLLAGAERVGVMTDDRITLEDCLRHLHVRFADLVGMIESGRIGWRGLLRGSKDLRGLVFDREEMRRLTSKAEDGGLSLVEAAAYSGFHKTVLNHFVAIGVLARPEAANPHNGRKVSAFRKADLDALRAEFVTLSALADEMNTEKAKLRKEIAAAGIGEVQQVGTIKQVVYRRADMKAWLEPVLLEAAE